MLCYAVLVQTQTPTQKILRQTMPAKTLSDSTEYRNNETANSKVPFASFLNLNKRNTSVFSYLEDIMKRSYHTNITAVSYGDDVTSHGRDVLDNLNVKWLLHLPIIIIKDCKAHQVLPIILTYYYRNRSFLDLPSFHN